MLGVSHPTVGAVRRELERAGDVETFHAAGRARAETAGPPSVDHGYLPEGRGAGARCPGNAGHGCASPTLTVRRAEVLARDAELDRRRNGRGKKIVQGPGWQVRRGDFRQALDDLDGHSVDPIVTDPPYGDDALGLWADLGEVAARVLKPGRPLVALTGKLRLPEVIAALIEHLEWVWEGCIAYRGPHRRVRKLLVDDCWRPFW